MKAIHVINPGQDSALKIKDIPTPKPADNEVLVKVEATALNRADLLQRSGNYPPPKGASDILGLEISGTVKGVGQNVQNHKKGSRVFGLLPGGGYAGYCVIHKDMAMPVPENLSFEEAAAIPETFLTAYQAMVWLGELQKDETVLIHAGGSGVGTSAIQLARRLFDATIITTASKQHKLDTCKKLGADYAFNYKEQNFAEEITNMLGKNAVTLIIDFIGAPYWEKNIDVMAMDARLVYLSFLGGHLVKDLSLIPILRKRLSIKGSTLRARDLDYKIRLTRDFAQSCLCLFKEGKIKPVIDSVFEWEKTEAAHQRMAENKNTGKIVLIGM